MTPRQMPPIGLHEPQAGVTQTSPATAPEHAPRMLGLPRNTHSMPAQATVPAAAARCVATKAFTALKLGLATFIVPFMFFYGPGLLFQGEALDIALVAISATLGVCLLAASTEGWFGGRLLPMALRVPLFGFALCLIIPGPVTDGIGLAGGAAIWLWQRYLRPAAA